MLQDTAALNSEIDAASILQRENTLPSNQRPKLFRLATGLFLGLSACFLLAAGFNTGGRILDIMDQRQVLGTCLLFILVPTYLLTLQAYQPTQSRCPRFVYDNCAMRSIVERA